MIIVSICIVDHIKIFYVTGKLCYKFKIIPNEPGST